MSMVLTKQEIRERNNEASKRYKQRYPERRKASALKWYYFHPEQTKANRDIQNAKRDFKKLINFKGKQIMLKVRPRTGICSKCGKIGLTNLHHEKYDESDPLLYTVELCVGCHNHAHKLLREVKHHFS